MILLQDYGEDSFDDVEISLDDLESLGLPGLEGLGIRGLGGLGIDGLDGPVPFLGLAKLKDKQREGFSDGRRQKESKNGQDEKTRRDKQRERDRLEELQLRPGEVPLPPMPTHRPDSFVPIIERLRPEVLQQLRQAQAGGGGGAGGGRGFIPGKAGVDYPDFKTIPATDFTCENFLLPGFYADTFTSCQVTGNRHLVKTLQ